MSEVKNIIDGLLEKAKDIARSETIIGEPIKFENLLVVPVVQVSIGFGAGGGSGRGEAKQKGEGTGGGTGGGAWVKPIAVIIISKDEVRVEPIVGGFSGAIEKIGEALPRATEKLVEKWRERKKEG